MVPNSRTESDTGTHLLSAKVRKTIQSIKEIVGNHSDADIYVALKETNMDPNETTQKLLNQDHFHEVKRRRDRKKEPQNVGDKGSGEQRRYSENAGNRGSGEPRRHFENVGNRGSGELRRHSENVGNRGSGELRRHSENVGNRGSDEPRQHSENVGNKGLWEPISHSENFENKGLGEPRRHSENVGNKGLGETSRHSENVGNKSLGEPRRHSENVGNRGFGETRRHSENDGQRVQSHNHSEHNARRTNYSRNPLSGISREFRVVRDNRVNHIYKEVKPPSLQHSTSTSEKLVLDSSAKGSSAASTNQRSSGARNYQASNGPSDSHARQSKDAVSNVSERKLTSEDKHGMMLKTPTRVQPIKPTNIHQNSSTIASPSSAVGVQFSSTDPVHVPSPDSRASGVVGAIRREVGVVGVRRQSPDNKVKQSFVPSSSHANPLVGKEVTSADSFQSVGAISKTEQLSQNTVTEPSFTGVSVSRPSSSNYNTRSHQQLVGHQRVSQHNKEWKPKSSQKTNSNNPGVIGTPKKTVSPPAENSEHKESDTAKIHDRLSQVNISENQNVVIAENIRVEEADRRRLMFGTIGVETDFDFLRHQLIVANEKSNGELTTSMTVPAPELSTEDVSGRKQVELQDGNIPSGVNSPASGAASEQQLPDNNESPSPQILDNYANIGLVRDTSPSYAPSESQPQESHEMPGFSAYDAAPTGYDIPYFRPAMDESVRGQVLSPPQEGLISHVPNTVPTSMMQQQQPAVAQMYPQLHVSHYANLMPYRQFLSPVYVPPMAVPGYSNNPPYPHPSNGSSYILMPGGGSHPNANNLKYGVQQFKTVPAGSPAGFGNFGNPTGYTMLAQGVVGGASALEDSSRIKYKDNLYMPNPQAETSEIWLQNPRDLSGMQQSTTYYNMPGQSPHAAPFMPSHTGHASFNPAVAQSSHMQYPGMYHTPPQPAALANPHHLGPGIGNNVGVGVAAAAPGQQVGAYQQQQLGHLNWTGNF